MSSPWLSRRPPATGNSAVWSVSPAEVPREGSRRLDLLFINSRFDAHAVQHLDQHLGGDIARGARSIGTPAEAAGGGVDGVNAGFQRRQDIGKFNAAGLMEMHREGRLREPLPDKAAHLVRADRARHTRRV